jgi:hypothetical protein
MRVDRGSSYSLAAVELALTRLFQASSSTPRIPSSTSFLVRDAAAGLSEALRPPVKQPRVSFAPPR